MFGSSALRERAASCSCSNAHSHQPIMSTSLRRIGVSSARTSVSPNVHVTGGKTRRSVHTCRSATVDVVQNVDDVVIPQFPAPKPGSFAEDRSSFFEQHRIRGYEVSPDQRASMVTIANLLQVWRTTFKRAAS